MQIGHRRIQSCFFQGSIRRALRPVNRVPINFEIRAQSHLARRSGTKDIGQIEQNRLLAACRKTQVVLRRDPAAAAVGHFNAQAMSAPAIALRNGDIHRRLSVVDRTLRDQVERATLGRVVAEIHFEIVIASQALELATPEAAHGFSVERADQISDVLARVIHRARNGVRRGDCGDAKFCRRNYEALVDKNLRARRDGQPS